MTGSFGKFLIVVAVIAIAWFGWRWFQRWEKERRELAEAPARARRERSAPRSPPPAKVEELVRCPRCEDFVPEISRACQRPNCPFPR